MRSSCTSRLARLWSLIAACCLLAAAHCHAQQADPRIALVIGNAEYKSAPLKNPVNDARAIARALKDLGFEVILKENITQQGFVGALREFGTRLKDGNATGLFYYAGHGMQVKGANYLIPVDAAIEGEDEIRYQSIDANQVLDKMEQAGNRLNIVILDACRDNPYARSFRSKQSGLAQMDAPSGMLVAFATAPGSVAYDGEGVNGVYTKHLLRNLTLPGMPVELVLKRVREGVSKDTEGKQIPWESSSLLGDFYFKVAAAQPSSAALGQVDSTTVELAFWDSVKDSGAPSEYRAYLQKYPDGQFASLARDRMNTLLAQAPAPGRKPSPATSPTQVALAQPSAVVSGSASTIARVGDVWSYDLLMNGRRQKDKLTITVTGVEGDRIEERVTRTGFRSFGAARTFKAGFDPSQVPQETLLPGGSYLFEFSPYIAAAGVPGPGREWKDIPVEISFGGFDGSARTRTTLTVQAVAEERVRVPAGEFSTVRVEAKTPRINQSWRTVGLTLTYWYSPELRRTVKMSRRLFSSYGNDGGEDTLELAGYQAAK